MTGTPPDPGPVLYSCTFSSYDWTFSPLAPTPGMRFMRFIDRRPLLTRHWDCAPLPDGPQLTTQTLTNRFCKLFPGSSSPGLRSPSTLTATSW